jgi:phage shock protein C
MTLTEELSRLHELHGKGALTDDEYTRAKTRLINDDAAAQPSAGLEAVKSLRRSRNDRWLGGVCGGLSAITSLPAWALRLLFALLALWGGAGVLVYLLLWIFVPEDI